MAVTAETIGTALGVATPTSTQLAQWAMWINDARMLIEARLGDLTALDEARLDYVVREAVVAMARRPDDATQVSIAVDDGTVSRTYRTGAGRVTILDEWWALLDPLGADSGAFSVTPYFAPDVPPGWLP